MSIELDNVISNAIEGTVTHTFSASKKADIGLGFTLTGSVTWSFSVEQYTRTRNACNGNIEYGIYYKQGNTLRKLVSLNNRTDNGANCSLEYHPAENNTYNYVYGGARNGTPYYSGTKKYTKTKLASGLSSGRLGLGTVLLNAKNSKESIQGSAKFSDINIPSNSMPSGYVTLYFGMEDNNGNIIGNFYITTVEILSTYVKSISLNTSSVNKHFYKNGTFRYTNLQVFADYYYQISGNKKETLSLPGYTVVTPNMKSVGQQTVTIKYYDSVKDKVDRTATYTINVYGVVGVDIMMLSTPTNYKKGGSIITKPNVKISYGLYVGNVYSTATITGDNVDDDLDCSTAGLGKVCRLTCRAAFMRTNEDFSFDAFYYNVYDVDRITLSGTYSTTFNTNDTFNHNGLIATAHYGANDEAGTEVVTSECVFSDPDMLQVGNQSVEVIHTPSLKSNSYNITVNGITSIRINTDNCIKKILKGGSFSYTGLVVYYTCSNQEETQLELTSPKIFIDVSDLKVNVPGEYEIKVSVTHLGKTLTATYNAVVYSLASLTLTGQKTEFYFDGVNVPTFGTGALVVTANYTNGDTEVLDANNYTVTAPSSMSVGSHEVIVTATKGDTKSETYEINVLGDTPVAITRIESTGWNDTFSDGEKFSSSGIKVFCTMASGATNIECSFSTNLDGLVFGTDIEDDTDLVISVVGCEDYESNLTALYDSVEETSLTTTAMRTRYKAGELIDLTGLVFNIVYAHSGSKSFSGSEITTSRTNAFAVEEEGSVSVPVTCKGQTKNVSVSVVTITDIEVSTTKDSYIRGQNLDLSTITVTATYSDDVEEEIDVNDCAISGKTTSMTPSETDGLSNKITFAYTECAVTFTCDLYVNVKCISSIDLNLDDDKITFNYGEPFSLLNKILTVTFNDGDVQTGSITADGKVVIDSTQFSLMSNPAIGAPIKDKTENSYILISFGGEDITYSFATHCYYLDSIVVDASSITESDIYAGETLDLSGVIVTRVMKSTDADEEEDEEDVTEDCAFSMNDGAILNAGHNDVLVSYSIGTLSTAQTVTASFFFDVIQVALTGISAVTTGLEKALNSYVVGQRLNVTGLVVNATFNRASSSRELSLTEIKYYIGVKEVAPNEPLTASDNGSTLKVSFTYDGVTKEATVGTLGVATKVLSSISVADGSSHIIDFYIGDYFTTANLNLEGLYNDGEGIVITDGFTTDFDSYKNNRFTSSDLGTSKTVTVTYNGKTCTYTINVLVPTISSVRFDTSLIDLSPTNGDVYTLNGLIVYAKYQNDYEEIISSSNWLSNVTTVLNIGQDGQINVSTFGNKDITVSVTNPYNSSDIKGKILTISVVPNMELQAIRLRFSSDDYDQYQVGDTFDAKGLIVEAMFKDATEWQTISGYFTNPELDSVLRSGGRKTIKVNYIDKGVSLSQEYTIVVSMPYESGATETETYKIAFNVQSVTHEEATIVSTDDLYPLFPSGMISIDQDRTSPTYGLNVYTGDDADADCVGYMKLGSTSQIDGSVIENGTVVLFDDPVNPIDGDGNIIVKFPHYVEGYADRINKAHFGIIYNKRLFVSGNKDFKNVDWHSSEVNSSQVENYDIDTEGDFTYFSDLDYCRYGSDNTAVTGYDVYRDGTLLVFKEGSSHESTIFTRTATYVKASSFDGNVVNDGDLAEDAYPMSEVNAVGGEGTIQVLNFMGETLILTRTGIKAVTSKESTYNNAKYTFDVSTCINPKIKEENIDQAFMFAYKEKLILKTSRGVYVGEYALRNENSEYEWNFLNNIDAVAFFELDGELLFSDRYGNLRRFFVTDKVDRVDKSRTYIGVGGALLTIDATNDKILVANTYSDKVNEGDTFHLLSHISSITNTEASEYEIHASLGRLVEKNTRENYISQGITSFDQTAYVGIIDTSDNTIEIKCFNSLGEEDKLRTSDVAKLFYTDRKIYFDEIVGTAIITTDEAYYLKEVEDINLNPEVHKFKITTYNGNEINLSGIQTVRCSFRISDLAVTKITNVEDALAGAKSFQLLGDHDEIFDLIYYNGRNGTYSGVITKNNKIESHFISKAYTFGTIISLKTIYMWVIANDTTLPSYMDVGYIFSRKQGDYGYAIKTASGSAQLDFGDVRFEKIQFTNDKLPHIYTKYKTLTNVGAIRFIFKNNEGTNMVLSHFSLVYALGQLMKGVK